MLILPLLLFTVLAQAPLWCSETRAPKTAKLSEKTLTEAQEIFAELDELALACDPPCATESALRGLLAKIENDKSYFDRKHRAFSLLLIEFIKKGYIQDGLRQRKKLTSEDFKWIAAIIKEELAHADWHVHYHGTNHIEAFVQDILTTMRNQVFQREMPSFGLTDKTKWKANVSTLPALLEMMEKKSKTKRKMKDKSLTLKERAERNAKKVKAYKFINNSQYLICTNLSLFGGNKFPVEYSLNYVWQNAPDRPSEHATQSELLVKTLKNHLAPLKKVGFSNMSEYMKKYENLFHQFFPGAVSGGRLLAFYINPNVADKISYVGIHVPGILEGKDGTQEGVPSVIVDCLRRNPKNFEANYQEFIERQGGMVWRKECINSGKNAPRPQAVKTSGRIFPDPKLFTPENCQTKSFDLYFSSEKQKAEFEAELSALVKEQLSDPKLNKEAIRRFFVANTEHVI